MHTISIIVPVYNTEQYLPQCIDSILSQSYADFELLLIDDGSTDGSGTICDAYAQKDKRVRVFHKENGGVSSARNLGLEKAGGEWICFVDSDDELMPNGLQVMVDGISDEVSMVIAGYIICDDNGTITYSIDKRVSCIIDIEKAVKELFAPSDYYYQGYICSKLLKRSVICRNNIGFSEDVFFNEDRLFLMQYICIIEKNVFYTTIPVYKYFERAGSAMMSLRKGFNPRFITDMEAQIKMRECVRARLGDEELLELADLEVYNSYRRIVGMMNEFQVDDKPLLRQLHSRLISSIGRGKYIKYEMHRDKRRVKNKLKKILRYG